MSQITFLIYASHKKVKGRILMSYIIYHNEYIDTQEKYCITKLYKNVIKILIPFFFTAEFPSITSFSSPSASYQSMLIGDLGLPWALVGILRSQALTPLWGNPHPSPSPNPHKTRGFSSLFPQAIFIPDLDTALSHSKSYHVTDLFISFRFMCSITGLNI